MGRPAPARLSAQPVVRQNWYRAVRRVEKAWVLAGYAAISFAYFGWRLLPHPGRVVFGNENAPLYIWSFGWWRHAIGSGINPLVSHALYAGSGVCP